MSEPPRRVLAMGPVPGHNDGAAGGRQAWARGGGQPQDAERRQASGPWDGPVAGAGRQRTRHIGGATRGPEQTRRWPGGCRGDRREPAGPRLRRQPADEPGLPAAESPSSAVDAGVMASGRARADACGTGEGSARSCRLSRTACTSPGRSAPVRHARANRSNRTAVSAGWLAAGQARRGAARGWPAPPAGRLRPVPAEGGMPPPQSTAEETFCAAALEVLARDAALGPSIEQNRICRRPCGPHSHPRAVGRGFLVFASILAIGTAPLSLVVSAIKQFTTRPPPRTRPGTPCRISTQ